MLEARPVQNKAARVETADDGTLAVYVKKALPWYWRAPLTWVASPRAQRRVALDRLGSEVWRLCDGTRTVEAVVDAFAERHRLTFHEARAAVTGYLRLVIQRGVLAIEMPEEEAQEERSDP
jgi:hypothetical protein